MKIQMNLLSISLGSAETTLLKLTSAYSAFVNGGKLVKPVIIDRVQDSEGNTIVNNEKELVKIVIKFLLQAWIILKLRKNNYLQVFSPQTAYQITSMLEGVIQRGTGKKLKNLKLNLAGKTGTTNKIQMPGLSVLHLIYVIGVYVGMDNPKPLGKFETGSKPLFQFLKIL